MKDNRRTAGILFPVASLPSRFGVGDFGKNAKRFAKVLSESGYTVWQILPLNPLGYGHSPYQPFSSYAIEELYIDLDALHEKGLIEEVPSVHEHESKILYEEIREYKFPYLKKAFFKETGGNYKDLEAWLKDHEVLRPYGYFMSSKRRNNLQSWSAWSKEEQSRGVKMPKLTGKEKDEYWFEIWLQKTLYTQYEELHEYCRSLGLKIVGDVPFYVGFDSCDVYHEPEYFLLDPKTKEPVFIAGVPPDYFSATGQRWGNPIYDWKKLEETGFSFLNTRLGENGRLYDVIRLDHFRAFDTYWKIPSSCPTAIDGEWILAPGYAFFDQFLKKYPNIEIIAEDLGNLRPEVLVLRDHYDFPGMNVVEFTFLDYVRNTGSFVDKENMVAYLGTHDNDTMKGYLSEMKEGELAEWKSGLDRAGIDSSDLARGTMEFLLSLKANLAVLSLSDLLGKGSEARINVPGVIDEVNWTYRETDFEEVEKALRGSTALLKKYNRL